jgi:peptidoglycan hydrolase CwlO-like protein
LFARGRVPAERLTTPTQDGDATRTEVWRAQTKVEERISALERTVAELVQSRRSAGRVKDWKRTVGMFSGNDLMKEIDAAGQKIREQNRLRARRPGVKRRRKAK